MRFHSSPRLDVTENPRSSSQVSENECHRSFDKHVTDDGTREDSQLTRIGVHRFFGSGYHSGCMLNVTAKRRTASQAFGGDIHSAIGGFITGISKGSSQLVEARHHSL